MCILEVLLVLGSEHFLDKGFFSQHSCNLQKIVIVFFSFHNINTDSYDNL